MAKAEVEVSGGNDQGFPEGQVTGLLSEGRGQTCPSQEWNHYSQFPQ